MTNSNVDFCCTCLKMCAVKNELVSLGLEVSQEITYRNKLQSCVPEMMLQGPDDCFLCLSCKDALEVAYNFRCMCLTTENKLQEYRALKRQNLIRGSGEDLLHALSEELNDIDKQNPVSAAQELGNLLSETIIKQETNTGLTFTQNDFNLHIISDDDLSENDGQLYNNTSRLSYKIQDVRKMNVGNKRPLSDVAQVIPKKAKLSIDHISPNKSQKIDVALVPVPKTPRVNNQIRAVSRRSRLSDQDIVKKSCKLIPALKNVSESALNCKVSLDQIHIKHLPVIVPGNSVERKKCDLFCKLCEILFQKRERFYTHMLKHSNLKGYRCDKCCSAYFSADSLRQHKKLKHQSSQNLPESVANVTASSGVIKQEKKINDKKKKETVEEKCILKIKLPKKIKKAAKTTKGTGGKSYQCNYCEYSTSSKQLYDQHSVKHSGGGSYSCALCPKVFFAQWVLHRHIRRFHNIESVPPKKKKKSKRKVPAPLQIKEEVVDNTNEIVCTTCTSRFTSESEYKIHLKTHITTKPATAKKKKKFFCTVCDSEFSSRDHANIHTGAKPYTCNVCAKTFAAYCTLRKHRNVHINEEQKKTKTSTTKKHVCEICKQEFKKADLLCSHNCQTSSGESVYRCQICKNAYLGRTALIEHMRIHVNQN